MRLIYINKEMKKMNYPKHALEAYLPAGFNDGAPSRTVKKVIARMPTPVSLEGIDPFKTDYREVA